MAVNKFERSLMSTDSQLFLGKMERNADVTLTGDLPPSNDEGLEGVNLGGTGELLKTNGDAGRESTSATSYQTASIVKTKLRNKQARNEKRCNARWDDASF